LKKNPEPAYFGAQAFFKSEKRVLYMLQFIGWLIIGVLIGWVASKIMNGKGGLFRNIIVGVAGSVVGGWLAQYAGIGSGNPWSIGGFLIATGGSCLLIFLSRLILGEH